MKKPDKHLSVSLVFVLLFVLFLILFFSFSAMVQSGAVPSVELSQTVQAALSFVMFLPLLVALFFLGRFLETKRLHPMATILKFISIGLFIFSIVQVSFSLLGFFSS